MIDIAIPRAGERSETTATGKQVAKSAFIGALTRKRVSETNQIATAASLTAVVTWRSPAGVKKRSTSWMVLRAMAEQKTAASTQPLFGTNGHARGATKTNQPQAAEDELVAYYRPIGIAAVAGALALRCARAVTGS